MPKTFRRLLYIFLIGFFSLNTEAQEKPKFKEVILNGKPAMLNIETGEVLLKLTKTSIDSLNLKSEQVGKQQQRFLKYHRVEEGETLLDISKKYKVSLTRLKALNNLETTLINAGQVLLINKSEENSKAITMKETKLEAVLPKEPSIHVVSEGETLYSISKSYNLTVNELKAMNNLKGNIIQVGQNLKVLSSDDIKEIPKDSIVVKKGDTLYSLAKRFNTSVEALKELNQLNSNLIKVGQELRVR